jgi:hypothetical protein
MQIARGVGSEEFGLESRARVGHTYSAASGAGPRICRATQ